MLNCRKALKAFASSLGAFTEHPGRYRLESGYGPQNSGLSTATRSQQTNLGALRDVDRDILNAPFGPVITRNIAKLQEVARKFYLVGLCNTKRSHLVDSDSYVDRDVEMKRLSNSTGSNPTTTIVSEPNAASPNISSEA